MPFVEPFLLWGALAVLIPVAIHFWHQKQGKPLPWAATQWLIEKQQQQSRGLRLDNVPLLIVRCLLLILLAILLANPILDGLTKPEPVRKIHLVQPTQAVADNFRFELTEAVKKGEKVIWADDALRPMDDQPYDFPSSASFGPLPLQTAINQLDTKLTELHLYLINTEKLASVPAIGVPARFKLHTLVDSSTRLRPYLAVSNDRKLFVNRAGKLVSTATLEPGLRFQSAPVHSGPVQTLVQYQNDPERQTVKAALSALTDVYGLNFAIDEKPVSGRSYDWVLTDQLPARLSPQTIYTVSGIESIKGLNNVTFTNERLTPQTSDRVATGQLPEWLGGQLLHRYGLESAHSPMSPKDLQALFVPMNKPVKEQHDGIQQGLLLALIGLMMLERWLALTKNA